MWYRVNRNCITLITLFLTVYELTWLDDSSNICFRFGFVCCGLANVANHSFFAFSWQIIFNMQLNLLNFHLILTTNRIEGFVSVLRIRASITCHNSQRKLLWYGFILVGLCTVYIAHASDSLNSKTKTLLSKRSRSSLFLSLLSFDQIRLESSYKLPLNLYNTYQMNK